MITKDGAFTNLNTVLESLRMTEALVKDLLSDDEELRDQVLLVYIGLAKATDQFVQAAYEATAQEDKATILTTLSEQIASTLELMSRDQNGGIIKFPVFDKPQA